MDYDKRLSQAIMHFWSVRKSQSRAQGAGTGQRDQGDRKAVTGGKQMDGFVELVRDILVKNHVPEECVYTSRGLELPGFFRPEKRWDLLVVVDGHFLAGLEFKSQIGSFGNNYNNRAEEAIGNATDLWTAYRERAFPLRIRPWLGYLMLLEKADGSTRPVSVREPHFEVFDAFRHASYAERYQETMTRLLLERLYDGACLLLSQRKTGARGACEQPNEDLSFVTLVDSLVAHIGASLNRLG